MLRLIAKDFRCFRDLDVPLAPLTLLVGENSTGKSTLLALFQLAWDMAFGDVIDFNKEPFRLGAYDDIARFHGGRGKRAASFTLGVETAAGARGNGSEEPASDQTVGISAVFEKQHGHPVVTRRDMSLGSYCVEMTRESGSGQWKVMLRSPAGSWELNWAIGFPPDIPRGLGLGPFDLVLSLASVAPAQPRKEEPTGAAKPTAEDFKEMRSLFGQSRREVLTSRPWAMAPVRTAPERNYDPVQEIPKPAGDHVPMLLARLAGQVRGEWQSLHDDVVKHGKEAGLFDDLKVVPGRKETDPFRVEVGVPGQRGTRSVVDVGYGVSQVLPVLVDALRTKDRWLLMQQPEVHLHPRAQAALGSMLAGLVQSAKKRFVVETHSDFIVDRVCMKVRDGLPPEKVSILYFEHQGAEVKVHPLRLDKLGNFVETPPGFRDFFLAEERRFLGL
jgi:predicted ATPase